jgi:hydroxymethyl cephem carbamoyltransferase
MKPGHDGSIALAEDNTLVCSLEAEKDSFERYGEFSPLIVRDAGLLASGLPDIVAIGGWHKHLPGHYSRTESGYFGNDAVHVRDGAFFGKPVKLFSSSHERSHLFMAAALAPDAPIE